MNLNLYDFAKERAYFEELDATELLVETPSPKSVRCLKKMAWEKDVTCDLINAIFNRWRISKTILQSSGHFKLMETPVANSTCGSLSYRSNNLNEALECAIQSRISRNFDDYEESEASKSRNICSIGNLAKDSIIDSLDGLRIKEESDENEHPSLEEVVNKGSPLQSSSLPAEFHSDFTQLLMACNQTEPLTLSEMFSQFWYLSLSLIKFRN